MPERGSYAAGTPSWIDLSTTDPAGARAFYGQLLGWEFDISPDAQTGNYTQALVRGKAVAGLVGAPMTETPPAWTTYFATDSAEQLGELVTKNGGTVIMPAMDVMGFGTMIVFQDPTGAFAAGWQAGSHTGAQLVNEPATVTWNELLTRDLDAASAFYTAILPVKANVMSDDENFRYQTLQVDGQDVAGMYQAGPDVPAAVPAHWAAYFAVADVDATAAKALELGGKIMMPAQDSPYGRFAGLLDPQGAFFYAMQLPAAD